MERFSSKLQEFLRLESAGGLILMATAGLALFVANSALAGVYQSGLAMPFTVQAGALEISKPILLWINDGLMAVFFFLVGLEIKREVLEGQLSSMRKASLPLFAAVGGMAIPALIYAWINRDSPGTLDGWAIPAATDIAFALGILALLGTRAPTALKALLLAIAIIDDLGAILVIALFYTSNLSAQALLLAGVGLVALFVLNRMGVKRIAPYALIGVFLWVCVLKSGVHATLAGVLTALAIPLKGHSDDAPSPLHKLEHGLHPWVAFGILPIFAFANAGVSLAGLTLDSLVKPATLGVALGLFLGKQIGVMAFSYFAVALRTARLPEGASWAQLYGVACLTGVGFTMSLFISGLAFEDAGRMEEVRLGVLLGSIASALVGYTVLRMAARDLHEARNSTMQEAV